MQAVAAVKTNADAIVDNLQSQGFTSVRTIAAQLNERGILTPRGGAWHPTSAARLPSRLQATGLYQTRRAKSAALFVSTSQAMA